MSARVIDGKAVAAEVRAQAAAEVAEMVAAGSRPPALATVLVGDDPASHVYVGNKRRACEEAGIRSVHNELPEDATEDDLRALLEQLNADDGVDGILLQIPLPAGLDDAAMTLLIDPAKDVDGLHPVNAGLLAQGREGFVSCTPAGVMELLRREGAELRGAEAVIVGRSQLVGRPLAALLTAADATVTVCHSRTRDLAGVCARADVLVAAVGVPRLVTREMVKPGAIVIDVGINRVEGTIVGDVDFEAAAERASAITPVPGGVGPMTIAMLLVNTVRAARTRAADAVAH